MPNILKKVSDACVKAAEAVDLVKVAGHIIELCSNGHKAATLQVQRGSICRWLGGGGGWRGYISLRMLKMNGEIFNF